MCNFFQYCFPLFRSSHYTFFTFPESYITAVFFSCKKSKGCFVHLSQKVKAKVVVFCGSHSRSSAHLEGGEWSCQAPSPEAVWSRLCMYPSIPIFTGCHCNLGVIQWVLWGIWEISNFLYKQMIIASSCQAILLAESYTGWFYILIEKELVNVLKWCFAVLIYFFKLKSRCTNVWSLNMRATL